MARRTMAGQTPGSRLRSRSRSRPVSRPVPSGLDQGSPGSGSPDVLIFAVTLALLGIGVVMVFSASSVRALTVYKDAYYFLKLQLAWTLIGICTMLVTMRIDYRIWYRFAGLILIGVLALLALVLVPGIGKEMGGSRRWIDLGPAHVQPSELSKIAMIFFLSRFFAERRDSLKSFFLGLMPPLMLITVIFGLIMLEPDLGTATTAVGTGLVLVFVAGARLSHLIGLATLGLPAFIAVMMLEPYRRRRFLAFLHPWDDPLGSGFHIIQSLLALGSGGLFGLGLGRSRQKFLYLPAQHTDFIFAIIGEELGLIGALAVVFLFFLLAWRGFRVALAAPDAFGSYLAVGITTMIILQAVINIGVVTGTFPITGITLPLISFGGSSLVMTMGALGILLNVSKFANID